MLILFSNLCLTFIYNFTGSAVVITSNEDYLVVDLDSCMGSPLLAEKVLRGSNIISFDLNVA